MSLSYVEDEDHESLEGPGCVAFDVVRQLFLVESLVGFLDLLQLRVGGRAENVHQASLVCPDPGDCIANLFGQVVDRRRNQCQNDPFEIAAQLALELLVQILIKENWL